jgi:hypothetical protein
VRPFDFRAALEVIVRISDEANRYVMTAKPITVARYIQPQQTVDLRRQLPERVKGTCGSRKRGEAAEANRLPIALSTQLVGPLIFLGSIRPANRQPDESAIGDGGSALGWPFRRPCPVLWTQGR